MEPASRKEKQKQRDSSTRGDRAKQKSAQQELKQRQRAEVLVPPFSVTLYWRSTRIEVYTIFILYRDHQNVITHDEKSSEAIAESCNLIFRYRYMP